MGFEHRMGIQNILVLRAAKCPVSSFYEVLQAWGLRIGNVFDTHATYES